MRQHQTDFHQLIFSILLFILLLTTGCAMDVLDAVNKKPDYIPTSYTGMDDLIIPEPLVPYIVEYEDYRFRPIVFTSKGDYETGTKIYVNPYISRNANQLDEVANFWKLRVNRESNSVMQIQKSEKNRIASTDGYKLVYTTIGYDDDRDKTSRYIERVYFIPITENQVTSIRMVRNIDFDDKNTVFWSDWQLFLKSLRIGIPSIHTATIIGKTHNTRHYHVRNLNFDIPLGETNKLNKWAVKLDADRIDIWNTDTGKIRVKYNIAEGFDYTKEDKNRRLKENAEGWGNSGSKILAAISDNNTKTFEYHELPFGTNDTIYGWSSIDEGYTTEMIFNVSYRAGKSIEIRLKGDTTTINANKEFIFEWLAQFRVIN